MLQTLTLSQTRHERSVSVTEKEQFENAPDEILLAAWLIIKLLSF